MSKNFALYVLILMIIVCMVTNIFVYPVFSKYTNLTSKEVESINNYHETELYPQDNPQKEPAPSEEEPTLPPESEVPPNEEPGKQNPEEEPIKVSNLNWFDSVHAQFPTYTKTRVIDIKSGLTYYVYRNGGHYHADVEPINKENTDIFFKIYNYEWSWTRRPVWVEILPNFWVAGSINGYPHGNAYIKDTGMEGHTCIHFLLSKTHGTKRVDEAHQACVAYAYEHGDEINNYL